MICRSEGGGRAKRVLFRIGMLILAAAAVLGCLVLPYAAEAATPDDFTFNNQTLRSFINSIEIEYASDGSISSIPAFASDTDPEGVRTFQDTFNTLYRQLSKQGADDKIVIQQDDSADRAFLDKFEELLDAYSYLSQIETVGSGTLFDVVNAIEEVDSGMTIEGENTSGSVINDFENNENVSQSGRDSVQEAEDEYLDYTLYDIISGDADTRFGDTALYAANDYNGIVGLWARHGYLIDSGADFWTFIGDPGGALKAWLAGGAASALAAAMQSVDNMTDSANELLGRDLAGGTRNGGYFTYITDANGNRVMVEDPAMAQYQTGADYEYPANYTIYQVCYTICTDVVLPVAGVILAFVFAYQIYELVCERNNMNDMGAGVFIQLFIKMFIAIIVIMNAWTLSMWVFDLARYVVNSATASIADMGTATLFSDLPASVDGHSRQEQLKWIFTYMICLDSSIDFGSCLVLFLQGLIIQIGMWIVSMLVSVIIYIRMIEIYIYCTLSPVPLATLMNRSWGQVGMNFIRSLAALAFQALIICLCLGIFNVLVGQTLAGETNSLSGVSDLTSSLWAVIGYAVILVFCMFRSGSMSRSIMNAH